MKKKKERRDPLTGEMFTPKKVTQKFKTSANQIKYNNILQSVMRQFLGILLRPLMKIHRILTNAGSVELSIFPPFFHQTP